MASPRASTIPSPTRPPDGTTITSDPVVGSATPPASSATGSTSGSTSVPMDDDGDAAVQSSAVLLTSTEDGLFFADVDGTVGEQIEVGAATLRSLVAVNQAGRFLILMDGISLTWVDVDSGAVVDIAQFSGLSPIGYRGVWVATADTTGAAPVERSWVLATSPDSTSPEWVLPRSEYPIAGGEDWVIAWDRSDLGVRRPYRWRIDKVCAWSTGRGYRVRGDVRVRGQHVELRRRFGYVARVVQRG